MRYRAALTCRGLRCHAVAGLFGIWLAGAGMAMASAANATQPRSPVGLWLTSDGNGVIRVAPCGTLLCASIVGIGRVNRGEPPPGDFNGRSECGLTIMDDLAQTEQGEWRGHILDPDSGKRYNARVWIDAAGRLNLRGYLGIPLLGETQVWTVLYGSVAADCRFHAAP